MLKLLKQTTFKDFLLVVAIFIFVGGSACLTLMIPDYMSAVTELVETGGAMSDVLYNGLLMLLCALAEVACTIISGFISARFAASFSKRLREKIYDKVVGFSMQEISSFSTSSLVTRSVNDVTQVQMCISMGLTAILRAPIICVWAIFKILGKGFEWTVATAIAGVLVIILIAFVMIISVPRFRAVQWLMDKMNLITRENLTGVRVVRAYNAEKYQESKFEKANAETMNNFLAAGRAMSLLNPGMTFVMNGISLAIYWLGAWMISGASDMETKIVYFSNMVVFLNYAVQVLIAFMMLSMIFMILPRAQVAAKRINEVLDTKTTIFDGPVTSTERGDGSIEFKNVTFKYPDAEEPVLKDISFKANPGETVAVIGSTGSGKSTLINLIPRFYDVTEGQVLVDGVDVREYSLKALHQKLGYVSQKAILFKGTLAGNIDYGTSDNNHIGEEQIKRAMEIAQGSDILTKDKKGIFADVAQGGTNYSGGQKQRISIARAIAKNPEIFIFDDSFSALDYKTDRKLRAGLKTETKHTTNIIVAQRIGTVMDADKIIVLDEGRMVGYGTHKELLANNDVYRSIALSQLSKEEL